MVSPAANKVSIFVALAIDGREFVVEERPVVEEVVIAVVVVLVVAIVAVLLTEGAIGG